MAGWDFFVQFPLDKSFIGPSDRRPPAISAFFQVKTSKHIMESVCIKLSNAERMAREVKPTFFAFGIDRGEGKTIKFELGHIGKAAISHILATLRKNDTLSFSRRKKTVCLNRSALEIEDVDTAAKLKDAIVKHSSTDIERYIKTKIEIAKNIGYDKKSFTSNFSLRGTEANDRLISLMIGEISELEVQDFSITETRFGISLPLQSPTSGILKMEPSNKEFGIVEFVAKNGKYRAEFECEVRASQAPWINENQFRVRISNDIFSFIFSPTQGFSNWHSVPDTKAHLNWDKLKNILYFLHICTLGASRMNVYLQGKKTIEAEFSSSVNSNWQDDELTATILAVDFMYTMPALRQYLNLSGSEFEKRLNNKTTLFTLLKNRDKQDLQISCTLSDDHKGDPADTKFIFPFGFICGGKLLAMLLIAEGLASIEKRDVRMQVQNIQLDAFGAYPDKKTALASLKASTSAFCDLAPDNALIVIEPSIFTAKLERFGI